MGKKRLPLAIESRQRFPAEEKYEWLAPALDAYALHTDGLQKELATGAAAERGVACHRGCSNCCKNATVHVQEVELRVISWFVNECASPELRARLQPRLRNHASTSECPFLLDDECSIHSVRPLTRDPRIGVDTVMRSFLRDVGAGGSGRRSPDIAVRDC